MHSKSINWFLYKGNIGIYRLILDAELGDDA